MSSFYLQMLVNFVLFSPDWIEFASANGDFFYHKLSSLNEYSTSG